MRRKLQPLPHQQLQLISLLALALIPIVLFGLIAWGHFGGLVSSDADRETAKSLDAVEAVLQQREQDLSGELDGYATWDQLLSHAATGDTAWAKSVVLDFVVQRDVADAALMLAGEPISSGPAAVVTAVQNEIAAHPPTAATTELVGLPDGVYDVAMRPLQLPAASAQASAPIVLAFARRLDERFVTEARAMTGWDVAVAGIGGDVRVATSLNRFAQLAAGQSGDPPASRQTAGIAGGARALTDASGRGIGWLLVANDLGTLGSLTTQLLILLAITLAPAVVGALLLSVALTFQIRRRVRVIESGIAAVAAGDLSVRLPEGERDEFERLAGSHNRLATALEHEDRTLARVLEATSSLRPDSGVSGVAQQGIAAAVSIFGLTGCELRYGDGAALASTGKLVDDGDGSATVLVAHGDRIWELRWSGLPARWAQSDRTLLRVFASQLGAAIQDAELYERAEERAKALDRVNRLQANFLRGVSHNLQSPLTAIVGLSDELRRRSDVPGDARRRADRIHEDGQRLRMLVRQLLTMSRMEAGTLRLESEPCAVEPIVRRAWEAQRSERECIIRTDGVPALAVADAEALEQVFWILFDNALRYAPTGPIRVGIAVTGGDHLRVRVEDEGPGVPSAERSLIFRRFQRGSTSEGHEGTGLGLDVARGLLRAMDATIRYEPGAIGACFVVEMPAEVAAPA